MDLSRSESTNLAIFSRRSSITTRQNLDPGVQVATQSSLHDHVIAYKADFNVLGTNNSLEVSDLIIANQPRTIGFRSQVHEDMSCPKSSQIRTSIRGGGSYCGHSTYILRDEGRAHEAPDPKSLHAISFYAVEEDDSTIIPG